MRAEQLSAEFGIAGVVEFADTRNGLTKAVISPRAGTGEIYLQGAHLTQFGLTGQQPLLFVSPNTSYAPRKAIRGGVPVIFPWFGANSQVANAPQHGFARIAPWQLEGVEVDGVNAVTLIFSLTEEDVVSTLWPHSFRASYKMTFSGVLSLSLTVENRSPHPITYEESLHTYFAVSDIARVAVSGLQGATYIDKTDNAARKLQTDAAVTIAAETDRVYLDTPRQCTIEDAGWGRRILVEKDGAASTVVWNPWAAKAAAMADLGDAWRNMVCVETGNIADNAVHLAPGDEHEMSATISLHAGPGV